MSEWEPMPSGPTGGAQWNDGPSNDAWNDNAGTNGNSGANGFDNAGTNGFDNAGTNGFDNAGANGFDAPGGGGGGGFACYNLSSSHNKADCPNPRVMKCRHCNEEGHVIRDCPTAPPREFTGECNFCHQEGHMIKDCPEKPAEVCRNCQEKGHTAVECTNPRKIDRSNIEEVKAEIAWKKIVEAAKERDIDDVKEGIQQYIKACPDTTYVELEGAFRNQEIGVWLIALESQAMMSTLTNMDLQGNLNKKYKVNYRFGAQASRPREREAWPKSTEENLERLRDAGDPVSRGITKCLNCRELGHSSKNCPQEKFEKERVVIMCFNCNEPGHRVRDCPQERVDKFACRNCGKGGHRAADCPEPRVAGDDVECRKCGETGHYSRDCPQGGGGGPRGCFNCGEEGHSARDCPEPKKIICRNCNQEGHTSRECPEPKDMSKVQCRNCDKYGHGSRECPKPRDYSRVQCQNCGEMGHTKVRCQKPTVAPDAFDDGLTGGGGFGDAAGAPPSTDWMGEAATNAGSGDNDGWGTGAGAATGAVSNW